MLKLRGAVAAALVIAAVLTLPAATLAGSLELHDGVVGTPPPMRDIQETIWFQGYLADGVSGDPVNATYAVEARIYAVEVAGSPIWGPETHGATQINDGWFSVELGSVVSPLPDFQSPPYYLQLTIDGEILEPRLKLASVPTALYSDGIDLPYAGSYSSSGHAFAITNTGPNVCGLFEINNAGSTAGALYGKHNGPGPAVVGYAYGEGSAVKGVASGTGLAGEFEGAVTVSDSLAVEGLLMARGNAVVMDTLLAIEGLWFAKNPVPGYVLRCADEWGNAEWGPAVQIDTWNEASTTIIGTDWTQYDLCEVSLTVPCPGYIVVTSNVRVKISHTNGTQDNIEIAHATSPAGAGISSYETVDEEIPSTYPTDTNIDRTFSVHSIDEIGAGTHTYYLVGRMVSGQDPSDRFWYAQMTAVFHPHPTVVRAPEETDLELQRKMELDGQ
jgi:hypothetical protein